MKNISIDVLVNPKPKQIAAALEAANAAANPPKAKARTCRFPADLTARIASRAKKNREGIYEDDGGAVANSYQYAAETSHVLAAWWTSGNGTRYVRVRGKREGARKASHGDGPGCTHMKCGAWEAVFPDRVRKLAMRMNDRALLAVLKCGEWAHWLPQDTLFVDAVRSRASDRIGDLLLAAKRLLPHKLQGVTLELRATSKAGAIISQQGQAYLVTRNFSKFCELLPVPPRFANKSKGLTDAEMVEAALNYLHRKDPRLQV